VAWECAQCNVKESASTKIDAVCHHCGKPLCRDDRVEIADNAFNSVGLTGPKAVHCRACKRKHHSGAVPLSQSEQ
jgi:hypothetical protein